MMAKKAVSSSEPTVYSVYALTVLIRQLFDITPPLQDVWVEGELSNFKQHQSGHLYFTLKDSRSQLKAVMWKSSVAHQHYMPQDGEKIRAHGKIGVYEASGVYQLYADVFEPLHQTGDLHRLFRERWDRLEAEGLFDEALKRPLPFFPQRIGVVTSPQAAAFHDIQQVLRRRYPLARVILSPTAVQGADAAPQIVQALRLVDEYGVDVILLARGGGSLEDLWCFNDEEIARAIRQTSAPVVTGVGHETDTTLVDGTADQRAPTPSAGAELITPDMAQLRLNLRALKAQLADAMADSQQTRQRQLENAAHKLRLLSPQNHLRTQRQRLDELAERLTQLQQQRLATERQRLTAQARALRLANPANLLERGYAIVTRSGDGKRLTDAVEAAPGTGVTVQLARGLLHTTVKERKLHDDQ